MKHCELFVFFMSERLDVGGVIFAHNFTCARRNYGIESFHGMSARFKLDYGKFDYL